MRHDAVEQLGVDRIAFRHIVDVVLADRQDVAYGVDQDADPLHADITPAVEDLGKLGPKVVPYLKVALNAKDELTRLHAQRALERALERYYGFVPGQGWTKPDGEARFRALWIKNGNYDAAGAEPAREASVKAWLTWSSTPPT